MDHLIQSKGTPVEAMLETIIQTCSVLGEAIKEKGEITVNGSMYIRDVCFLLSICRLYADSRESKKEALKE